MAAPAPVGSITPTFSPAPGAFLQRIAQHKGGADDFVIGEDCGHRHPPAPACCRRNLRGLPARRGKPACGRGKIECERGLTGIGGQVSSALMRGGYSLRISAWRENARSNSGKPRTSLSRPLSLCARANRLADLVPQALRIGPKLRAWSPTALLHRLQDFALKRLGPKMAIARAARPGGADHGIGGLGRQGSWRRPVPGTAFGAGGQIIGVRGGSAGRGGGVVAMGVPLRRVLFGNATRGNGSISREIQTICMAGAPKPGVISAAQPLICDP